MHDLFYKLLGLPVLASEHGKSVDDLIIFVHVLMILLFVGWLGYFGYVIYRFRASRNPKADYAGVTNHASNYIEGAVAIVEGVLLLGFAVPLWAKAVDKFPDEKDSVVVHVVGEQFNWNACYAGKDGKFGHQDMKFVSATNIFGIDPADPHFNGDVHAVQLRALGEMHVVINKPVIAYISSKDVIHSFKIIAMRVTQDAIPGMRIPIWFKPTKEGRYQINCAQLCGLAHSTMSAATLVVESQEAFDKWLASKSGPAVSFE